MRWHKPVILLGAGARGADIDRIISWGIPILTSWQAKDLIDNSHSLYFGSPGIYGQRCANKILASAWEVIALGNRLSIWNVGHEGIRKDQKLIQVEIDEAEIKEGAKAIIEDVRTWVEEVRPECNPCIDWLTQCNRWLEDYPWLEEETHKDTNFINSYRFTEALGHYLRRDEVVVTEMGAPLMAAHQILCIRPPQRLMTSGGLGEMGCGLPAAIGASFARNKGPVLCLSTDGGMMMNLQELQTIVHHNLPVKIIVFNNSGYGMLKQTQENAGMQSSGVDSDSGVSFPNFRHVALAFGITASEVRTWEDFERIIPGLFSHDGPQLVDYIMDPKQRYYPKLGYQMINGKQVYDRFDQMAPHD